MTRRRPAGSLLFPGARRKRVLTHGRIGKADGIRETPVPGMKIFFLSSVKKEHKSFLI
jgi:hypothetical protein